MARAALARGNSSTTSLEDIRNGGTIGGRDSGAVVADLQSKLARMGYSTDSSGSMDRATVEQLQQFQKNNRIQPTGKLGGTTLKGMERALAASITLEEFMQIAPQMDEKQAKEWLPHLNASMSFADINNDKRKAAYLAQIAHETDRFRTFTEYASGAAYEGRRDLGNTQWGDGRRYKGRGAIQLTGRVNYRAASERLGVDFEKNPELLERPEYAFLASADYWKRHNLNALADKDDFEGTTDVINYYDPESRRRMRREHHARAKYTLAKNKDRHLNQPGTIGGLPLKPGEKNNAAPWWSRPAEGDRQSEPQRTEKQQRYDAWFDGIVGGNALATRDAVARNTADYRQSQGMKADGQDAETADAGLMWQLGDAFAATHVLSGAEDWSGVMKRSNQAADRTRELRDRGLLSADRADSLLEQLGKKYSDAKERAAQQADKGAANSAPIYDQHKMKHQRNWAFCGLSTLATTLEANGLDSGVDFNNRASIDRFKQGIYIHGKGTSGAGMAGRMRKAGLEDAQFSTEGSVSGLMPSLAEGKAIPVGFVSMGGEVTKLPEGSKRYGHLREGSRHEKVFRGDAGHWATLVGFEGPQENPTHLLVNDPDTGAQIRMTRAEFEKHTKANTGIWNVNY